MSDQNNQFYIAVCDDEEQDIEKLGKLSDEIMREEGIASAFSYYKDGKCLLEAIQKGENFDLLLLDVMMPQQNGMKLAKALRENSFHKPIVFISSNREMAMLGYEVSAVRYLAKPVDRERLREALLYCFRQRQEHKELLLPVTGGTQKILPKEILYIEVQGRGCQIKLEQASLYTNMRISELDPVLQNQGFIRSHQSFLVNLRFIRAIRSRELELINGENVPISKHRIQAVRQAFFSYLQG